MMKTLSFSMLMLVLAGCDICTKAEECAKKAGTAFSISSCRTDATRSREQANTKGCASEYGALESCAASLRKSGTSPVSGSRGKSIRKNSAYRAR